MREIDDLPESISLVLGKLIANAINPSISPEAVMRALGKILAKQDELIQEVKQIKLEKPLKRRFVNVKQAAQILNCSERTIYRLKNRGLLLPCKASARLQFPVEQLENFYGRTT